MTVLYVVTTGCYSDYSICGIYDTREGAQAAVGNSDDKDGFGTRIEVWGLNDWADERARGLTFFTIRMTRNGEVEPNFTFKSETPGQFDQMDPGYFSRPGYTPAWFSAGTWAKDEQHAIKIVNEKRIAALAMECRTPNEAP